MIGNIGDQQGDFAAVRQDLHYVAWGEHDDTLVQEGKIRLRNSCTSLSSCACAYN